MSRLKVAALLAVTAVLGACAASKPAHVLSGEASTEAVLAKADESAQAGNYRAAAILYQQALSQDPSAEASYRLGMVLRRLNRPDNALRAFQAALVLDPDHVPALRRLGLDLTARDEAEAAMVHLRRLLELEPDDWRAHNALGIAADLLHRFDEAAEHYAAAIELEPTAPQLWSNLGYSYYLAGDDAGAIRSIQQALELDPDHRAATNNLALVLARRGDYDRALKVLSQSAGDASAHADIGYLAFRLGDYDEAEALLAEAIRLSPTFHRKAHRNLAAVREARRTDSAPADLPGD